MRSEPSTPVRSRERAITFCVTLMAQVESSRPRSRGLGARGRSDEVVRHTVRVHTWCGASARPRQPPPGDCPRAASPAPFPSERGSAGGSATGFTPSASLRIPAFRHAHTRRRSGILHASLASKVDIDLHRLLGFERRVTTGRRRLRLRRCTPRSRRRATALRHLGLLVTLREVDELVDEHLDRGRVVPSIFATIAYHPWTP